MGNVLIAPMVAVPYLAPEKRSFCHGDAWYKTVIHIEEGSCCVKSMIHINPCCIGIHGSLISGHAKGSFVSAKEGRAKLAGDMLQGLPELEGGMGLDASTLEYLHGSPFIIRPGPGGIVNRNACLLENTVNSANTPSIGTKD